MDSMTIIAVASIIVAGITTGFGTMGPALAENASGTTLFVSSHLLSEVEQLSTRVGVLDRGRLVLQDDLPTCAAHRPGARAHARPRPSRWRCSTACRQPRR